MDGGLAVTAAGVDVASQAFGEDGDQAELQKVLHLNGLKSKSLVR